MYTHYRNSTAYNKRKVKQYAEEKFMATNLSSTNIRNENTKSKASREFRELHSNTPIRFGNMEKLIQLHSA